MGCRISGHETPSPETMPRQLNDIDYKSRLERKICLAKEIPEPIYDLSECNLKDVPSGVFIVCKVLRKDTLLLNNNKLHSLNDGGMLADLTLITCLDISYNKFKKLPEDIYKLNNLREFNISNNHLEILPTTLYELKNLEILDISHNNLSNIEQIYDLFKLKTLNIKGNIKLLTLPDKLATCENLEQIYLDNDIIQNPSYEITNKGTIEILIFLSKGNIKIKHHSIKDDVKNFLMHEKQQSKIYGYDNKYEKEKMLLEHERHELEKDYMLEAQLHSQQQLKKQDLLKELLNQQNETDSKVNRLQQEKLVEKSKLINDLLLDEEKSQLAVYKLLSLKNEPDQLLLEKEQEEQERILDQLRIQQSDLRKQEIISAMTELLEDEINRVEKYQEERDASSRDILEKEQESNLLLYDVFINYDQQRSEIIDNLIQDDQLQKSAVATLIAKNDARTWGLVEQVRIVETQLATLTHYEIQRKKYNTDMQVNELAATRMNLTLILLDLLEKQEKRKEQLMDTLRCMEDQRGNNKDFWLLQYQKLLDSQPSDISFNATSIDPYLGYNFFVNGVVHCLPFLLKIWQDKNKDLENINDEDLLQAGVKSAKDRSGILKSIHLFLVDRAENLFTKEYDSCVLPNASTVNVNTEQIQEPDMSGGAAALTTQESDAKSDTNINAECVVCMEETCKIIFLPCGHMCCCSNCQINLNDCPMCRSNIERRIRVILP